MTAVSTTSQRLSANGNAVVELAAEYGLTRFGEIETAVRTSQFNFKPTWGVSTLRYTTSTTGAGAAVGEVDGEFRLQSGTDANGLALIQTNQRGQYQSGTMGQAGIGARIPTLPLSTAFCEWGYTDFTNGFYFGVDGTGRYVAYVTGGVVTKAYQADWNVDTLDGTGVSGRTLSLANGGTSQIDFLWYGYGDIEFVHYWTDPTTRKSTGTIFHRFSIPEGVSIVDPNQPLSFRVGNGASTTTNVSLYIGGHQFSVKGGSSTPQRRPGSELLSNYTTALSTDWQPILAVRKKANFNGRTNSVNVRAVSFEVAADSEMEVRVTVGGVTSNGTWGTPTGRTATETAVETKVTGGTVLTTSSAGEPLVHGYIPSAAVRASAKVSDDTVIVLGATIEVILWIKRYTASGAMIVKHAHLDWVEEF